ncbi:MAG TPA: hypothetical protein VFM55_17695 [Micromonosporaceae bacterium]|nr:hypothetical protein [Micromonosporaceae bacterium]
MPFLIRILDLPDADTGGVLGLLSAIAEGSSYVDVHRSLLPRSERDADLLLDTLRQGRPRLAYVIPEFHNPTGHLIAAIRQAVDVPLDVYVEAADDFGGPVRHYEVPELVRVATPIYLKFTVRNAPGTYPSGLQVESTVVALARERVRRAEIGLGMLRRYYPQAVVSPQSRPPLP